MNGKLKVANDLEEMKKEDPELFNEILNLVKYSKIMRNLKKGSGDVQLQ